jgi:hypothetical protein
MCTIYQELSIKTHVNSPMEVLRFLRNLASPLIEKKIQLNLLIFNTPFFYKII